MWLTMQKRKPKVLLLEDDQMLTEFIGEFLRHAGCIIFIANNATDAINLLNKHAIDLIILDLSLPDEDGLVLLRKWQHSKTIPIMVISSRSDDSTRIAVLELGAADYLAKPFHPQELLLRMKRLLNSGTASVTLDSSPVITLSNSPYLAIDLASRQIISDSGIAIELTRAEFDILASLAKKKGAVIKRNTLIDTMSYLDKEVNPNSLGVLIHRIRKKLSVVTAEKSLISTVPNVGFRLNIDSNL